MYLATLIGGNYQWLTCLHPSIDSASVVGLELVFVRVLRSGELLRYAWPVDRTMFRALLRDDAEIPAALLQRALASAQREERTLPLTDEDASASPATIGAREQRRRWTRTRRHLLITCWTRLSPRAASITPKPGGAA